MEGKAVLFKKFANVDCFDLELDTTDVDAFCDAVALLEPTFGGINLEDIKAPECFEIEKRLKARMKIPVFHDDQHGTAIVVAAAIRNGLRVAGKNLEDVHLVCTGAGAAALACLNLLVFMGLDKKKVSVCDEHGVLYEGRDNMDPYRAVYARNTDARKLDDVIGEADVFLGLSAPNVLSGEQVKRMAASPFILALANPDPEISPDVVKYPRLMMEIPQRVARAAMESGVATRPIEDFDAYRRKLRSFVFRSGLVMKPVFERAQSDIQRVVLAEGASPRVLNAVQILVDDAICHPVLLGRHEIIEAQIEDFGLRLSIGNGFSVVDPNDNAKFEEHRDAYHRIMQRAGVSPEYAGNVVRSRMTALAALMVREGEADALVCGTQGAYAKHLRHLSDVIGLRDDVTDVSALMLMILGTGTVFLADTHVTVNPTAEEISEIAQMASGIVSRFGIVPKIGLLSHSNFGSRNNEAALKMREARELISKRYPDLAVEGEMHADAALSEETRNRVFPNAAFKGEANLLIMPNLDAANITYNMVKVLGDGLPVGPMLMGLRYPAHVVTESTTVRGIVNLCAIAAVDAIDHKRA